MVKVVTKRKRGRPATRVQSVKVKSGGTQVKPSGKTYIRFTRKK